MVSSVICTLHNNGVSAGTSASLPNEHLDSVSPAAAAVAALFLPWPRPRTPLPRPLPLPLPDLLLLPLPLRRRFHCCSRVTKSGAPPLDQEADLASERKWLCQHIDELLHTASGH